MTANQSGSYNTSVGYNTGPNGTAYQNTTCLGVDALANGNNMVRIGNSFVTSIGGQVGWTALSDGRFKEFVQEDVPGLSFISQLRPVTYRLNREKINDFNGVNDRRSVLAADRHEPIPFIEGDTYSETTTGFIAHEVEAAANNLGFDFSGVDKPKTENDFYGLRYAEFVVPLVKAVQEQQQQIELLKQENELLKSAVQELKELVLKSNKIENVSGPPGN